VGKSKGKGYGDLLLDACVADARAAGCRGVAMTTRKGNWLAAPRFFASRGFETVDTAPPDFELMVMRFGKARNPKLPHDWDVRARRLGRGLTVVRSDQCPYLDDATNFAREAAVERGIPFREIEFTTSAQLQQHAPSPYGVFSLVLDGKLSSHHYLLKKDVVKLLDEAAADR
jgi:hypothetical protein